MIVVPAGLLRDLQVIANVLEEGNAASAFQLLTALLSMLEAEAD